MHDGKGRVEGVKGVGGEVIQEVLIERIVEGGCVPPVILAKVLRPAGIARSAVKIKNGDGVAQSYDLVRLVKRTEKGEGGSGLSAEDQTSHHGESLEAPCQSQAPSSKLQNEMACTKPRLWSLEVDASLEVGSWSFELH